MQQEVLQGRLHAQRINPAQVSRTLGICMSNNIPATNAKRAVADLIAQLVTSMCEDGSWPALRTDDLIGAPCATL